MKWHASATLLQKTRACLWIPEYLISTGVRVRAELGSREFTRAENRSRYSTSYTCACAQPVFPPLRRRSRAGRLPGFVPGPIHRSDITLY